MNTVAGGHDDDQMQRRGSADEAARAALFLAMEAPLTSGSELPVDVTDAAGDPLGGTRHV
ncbi:hypothetical protein G3I40_39160 [Streptomyces sp. SID14478]|nr:hypothetical protein [Streptomyces sp. SID14478]